MYIFSFDLRAVICHIDATVKYFSCRALHDNNLYGEIPPDMGNCTELLSL